MMRAQQRNAQAALAGGQNLRLSRRSGYGIFFSSRRCVRFKSRLDSDFSIGLDEIAFLLFVNLISARIDVIHAFFARAFAGFLVGDLRLLKRLAARENSIGYL
jgi:hypothetical protein